VVPRLRTPVPWSVVFADEHPVEVEIGPGRGEVLLAAAAAAPATNFFAIERTAGAVEALRTRAAARGLHNVALVAGDARCIVGCLLPDRSVGAYRIYFPDPWPKRRHHRRRLVTPALARDLERTLVHEGVVDVASDLPEVVGEIAARMAAVGLLPVPGAAPPLGLPVTTYERRYATRGTVYVRFARSPSGRPR
jgi:tRNA (guanine-N7-)-methyltransferase